MSSVNATITLTELCHPDCTQKVLRSWGSVTFSAGTYTSGGLVMGLLTYLDQRTVDFNGFLKCEVWGEEPVSSTVGNLYHYSPVGDLLQIFTYAGVELANGAAIPASVLNDVILFEAQINRTTVLG